MAASHLMPSAPPLSGRYLAFTDREQIALWRAQGHGVRDIARELGRAPSTISRELRRNAATRAGGFEYRATTAQWHADRAARRPKLAKLAINAQLQSYVQEAVGRHGDRAKPRYRSCSAVEGAPARSATASAMGPGVESRADRPAPPARLPRQ
jgi:helix-turn-helix protein